MKNKLAILSLVSIIGLSLFSCKNREEIPDDDNNDNDNNDNKDDDKNETKEKTLKEMYGDLNNSYRINGTFKTFENDKVNEGTFVSKFTPDTFHIDRTVDGESGAVDFFRIEENGESIIGVYELSKDNEATLTPYIDGEGAKNSWSMVSNPFLDESSDSALFSKKDKETYYLDFSLDGDTAGLRYKAAKNFTSKLTAINIYSYETFEFKIKENKIDEIFIKSKEVTSSSQSTKTHFEITMKVDSDQNLDNKADVMEPLKHESYHDKLKTAFDTLVNGGYSFYRESNVLNTKLNNYEGYMSQDVIYYRDEADNSDEYGIVLLDDGYAHEVLYKENKYVYEKDPTLVNGEKLNSLKSLLPMREGPVEGFIYNEADKLYVLKTTSRVDADKFAYYIDVFADFDTTLNSIIFDTVSLTLNANNQIDTMSITKDNNEIKYTFTYDTSKLPFNKEDLTEYSSTEAMFGTYEGTLKADNDSSLTYADKKITITIGEQPDKYQKIYTARVVIETKDSYDYYTQDVTFYNDIFEFYINVDHYVLKKENDGSFSLTLTKERDGGNYENYSCVLTKSK